MRSSLFRSALVAALSLLSTSAVAGTLHLDPAGKKPDVHFFAEGTIDSLNIDGVSNEAVVTDDGTTLSISVKLKSVKTGIDTRDEHMCEHMMADTYPDVVLSVAKSGIAWPTETGKKVTGTIPGTFSGRGKSEPVKVAYTVTRTATGWSIDGKFDYDTDKLDVGSVSYLGVGVDNHQKARATLYVTDTP